MKLPFEFHGLPGIVLRVVIFMTLVAGCFAAADDKKIVDVNGGFEMNDAGLPAKWDVFGPSEGRPILSKENPHGGTFFLRVPIGSFSATKISGVQQSPPANMFKPGDIVTISANVRLKTPFEEGTMAKVAFELFGPDGKVLGSVGNNPANTPGDWQALTNTITIPSGFGPDCRTKVIASVFCKNAPAQENAVDFDDIVLSVAPAPKQPTP